MNVLFKDHASHRTCSKLSFKLRELSTSFTKVGNWNELLLPQVDPSDPSVLFQFLFPNKAALDELGKPGSKITGSDANTGLVWEPCCVLWEGPAVLYSTSLSWKVARFFNAVRQCPHECDLECPQVLEKLHCVLCYCMKSLRIENPQMHNCI